MSRKDIIKLVILILAVAGSIFLFYHYDLYSFFSDRKKIIIFLHSFGPLSVLVFIGLQILQVLFAPIPGEVTGFIGGYVYGIFWGTLYSTIGLAIGSWLAFGLSRIFGLPLVERVISAKVINKYDQIMAHQGTWVAFLLFLIPGFPKDALCYVLGLSHMKTRTFVVITTVGRLLGTLMLSVQGNCVRNNQDMAFFIMLGVSGILFLLGYFFGRKWLNELHKPHSAIKADPDQEPKQNERTAAP
jgi:uncharacterized membrane protein YdjX (TVP38/TMEM64 family)